MATNLNSDDGSTSSQMSAVTNLFSQLNEVETAVLSSSAKRDRESNKELLKQLAILKLQLLNDESVAAETPKSSSSRASVMSHSRASRGRGLRDESPDAYSRSAGSKSNGRRKSVSHILTLPNRLPLEDDSNGPEIEIPFNRAGDDTVSVLNSSPSVIAMNVSNGRNNRKAKAVEDKEFENAGYQPDLVKETRKGPERLSTTLWSIFANVVTFLVPDCLICAAGAGAKKAWREKVAIFFLFLVVSGLFVVMVSLVPIYICVESEDYYDMDQVAKMGWNSVFGKVYDLNDFVDLHPGGSATIERYFGLDASRLFARLPPAELPSYCLSDRLNASVFNESNSLGLQDIVCSSTEEELFQYGDASCHVSFAGIDEMDERLGEYQKGILVMPGWDIGTNGIRDGTQVIVIDNAVYNVTRYIDGLRTRTFAIDPNHETNDNAYLSEPLHNLIVNKVNEDATELFHTVFRNPDDKEAIRKCLNELFFHAQIDQRFSKTCARIATSQYALAGVLAFLILVQVGCSLAYIARRPPMVRDEDKRAAVMVMVPCYNESDNELRKTIDSVLANDYPDENRVLVVVADGVITGRGETKSCPATLAEILGFTFDPFDDAQAYESVGAITTNYASIYSGTYSSTKCPGKALKYIVVVKQGGPKERGTARAGNRGKRDSQLLLFGILNRIQYNRRPTNLDLVFMNALRDLNLSCIDIEYLMAIDADTRVSKDAIKYFVYKLDHDKSVLACCGETQVDNKAQSFVTMIQVFEYYSAHHLKKAFESVFGCVTCLPGCFTMYRLYTEEFQPLLACDNILIAYSRNDISSLHERNLYELGEDRMLTTLMLQEFHRMQLSFVPEAICWTIVPHTVQILKSQRRRWINSTLHNMCELLKVETMCGVCFFSMKMVVVFDLVSTFLLPSGCAYLYYIIVDAIQTEDPMGPLQILAFAYVGLMTLPFVFRAQWDYFLWFFFFLIGGIPAFYFYLPIYAFWNMDDLSWGKTRQVQGSNQPHAVEDDKKDPKPNADAGSTQRGTSSADESISSFAAKESSAAKEAEQLKNKEIVKRRRRRIFCCFILFVVLMIGAAFAVHHYMYDDILFDYFKDAEPEPIESTTAPDASDLDWAITSPPTQPAIVPVV